MRRREKRRKKSRRGKKRATRAPRARRRGDRRGSLFFSLSSLLSLSLSLPSLSLPLSAAVCGPSGESERGPGEVVDIGQSRDFWWGLERDMDGSLSPPRCPKIGDWESLALPKIGH
eukprot:scaffold53178_cov24-Tisochrysis_lutea.AAC.1